ncbi:hypothetical protein L1987_80880 [Smallanthus sonchifolius]|uniref:Uncharacterized protein n=1 Tax=Smallanthus sonchifolius TaxID=185202 RepID=A0ACB8YN88_9ASTR|nr:hypothetical protein L1987_80880 [Smallanthus sonchifolius]
MCPTGTSLWPARTISDLRSAFEILDVDRDGKISHEDLKTSYADADDDVIGSMMTVADSNKDGYVEYDEFEKVFDSKRSGGVLEDVFKAMDGDGDGKVGFRDLRSYLNSAGFEVSDDEIEAMIKLGDGDDEIGGVTFDGFLNRDTDKVVKGDSNSIGGVLKDVFKAMDGDGDGKVGYGDLRGYLKSAGFEVSDDEIKGMIKLGDGDDESGGVTFDGFMKILAV